MINDDFESVLKKAGDFEPTIDSWGFFSYHDASGGIGGGVGGFFWQSNRDDLLFFVDGFVRLDWRSKVGASPDDVTRVIRDVQSGNLDLEAGRKELNHLMQGHLQIPWWGTLGELMTSDADFPTELRENLYDSTDPILREGLDDFVDGIRSYGA